MDKKVKILCVDDEINVLFALERLFLDEDYEILTATSGGEGLKILSSASPIQIVISDYRMPVMNGVEFLREVCMQWPDTVRVVLSGYADTAAIVSAINEGEIYRFVPKPWNADELKIAVNNALERYYLNKKNVELMAELKIKNVELEKVNSNLGRIVAEKISKVMFQNKILTRSRNVLDGLPVAVMSMDIDGLNMQCNRKFEELCGIKTGAAIRKGRTELLPEELNAFVETIVEKKSGSGKLSIYGVDATVKGACIRYPDQEEIVLVLDWDA